MMTLGGVLVAVLWLFFMVGLLSLCVRLALRIMAAVVSPEVADRIRERLKWSGWTR